ncbi:LLM class flavin-dependent oxidoreductase [Streptomyces sp. NPDC052396]|uniref:LLM class flavin-dependent oxidoreductase n=1 Tax=Streptomyces sp. NPDC052396 TaxID=3365689 RepID=UPI0037D27726
MSLRCGVNVPTFGEFADIRLLAQLAASAEESGWDGFFLWDHVVWPWAEEAADPWIALTAVALHTQHIRIGPLVTPLPRRRPQKVARETVSLDRLSGGRLTLGAGSGAFPQEFDDLGEPATDARTRAAVLDESLAVLAGLWSGETFSFSGAHHRVHQARFLPAPVQRPRIPVWVGGQWPLRGPLERALRWDGYVPLKGTPVPFSKSEVADIAHRVGLADRPGFDLVISDRDGNPADYAAAGATWWVDTPPPWDISLPEVRDRIAAGPPRL